MSIKGVGVNNLNIPLAQFNLEWIHTSWGTWCWNYPTLPAGLTWVFNLYNAIPPQADLLAALANPYHGNWWGVGSNERDYDAYAEGMTTEQSDQMAQVEAALVSQQIAAIKAVQPTAKFALATGSQEHAPDNQWDNPVWIDAVWGHLSANDKDGIKALRIHWYAQVEFPSIGDVRTFNKAPIKREGRAWKDWAIAKGRPDLQVWFDEIGLVWNGVNVIPSNPLVNSYPSVIQAACNETGIERWCWYGFEIADYVSLWQDNITPFGQAFAVI